MNILDIVYPVLADLLDLVCDNLDKALEEEESDCLNEQFECIDALKDLIVAAYAEGGNPCLRQVMSDVGDLGEVASAPFHKFRLLLEIGVAIEGEGGVSLEDDVDVDPDRFKIAEYQGNALPFKAFGYFNGAEPDRSLAYLEVGSYNVGDEIERSQFPLDLLAAFYLHLSKVDSLVDGQAYVLFRSNAQNQLAAESAIKLLATFSGAVVHDEVESSSRPIPRAISDRVCATKAYNQFEETLIILSEVNHSKGIINKFLNIYHVIESFMYKVPLVNLGEESNNNLFSIRDFRALYERTSDKEIKAIEKLFNDQGMGRFWSRNIDGDRFESIVSREIVELDGSEGFDIDDCSEFLSNLQVSGIGSYDDLTNNVNAKKYSELVYKVRCSIVHNKET